MLNIKNLIKLFISFAMLSLFSLPVQAAPHNASAKFNNLFIKYANHYFDGYYFPDNPTLAVQNGIHAYDDKLEDYSQAAIQHKIAALKEFEANILSFDPAPLSQAVKDDRELLLNSIRSQLLTLQTIRPWEKDPDSYSSGITNSAFVIMERNYAPVDVRLRALIAREKLMPQVLQEARKNLKNPPEIYTRIALEQLPGLINFFKRDLPNAFSKARSKDLRKEFNAANAQVIQALRHYQDWLKNVMLPNSHGDYRIGAETFQKKLQYDEMVDTPLPRLLEIGMADLRKNQQDFVRVAKEIDPDKSAREVLAGLTATHPAPDQLLKEFDASLGDLTRFITDKKIISIPAGERPVLEETPPFMRATTFASMDTPGPFETASRESYFNVTLPDPGWNREQVEDFMKTYTHPTIVSTSIHEVYPGHFMHYLWLGKMHDRVRRIISANTNVEGWAHYTEQMMIDEGYGDPRTREGKMLRLGQLLDALLRNARYIVGIKMHTGQMSFNEAVKFFEQEGYQQHTLSVIEAKRATSDPTYLYYTLGKLQILKLRKDMETKEGKDFSLQTFHDNFMRQGMAPIKIVRRAMMHDDSPTI